MAEGSLQTIINAASDGLSAAFYFFEPTGITVLWAFSLFAILRLLLRAGKQNVASGVPPQTGCAVPPWFEWAVVGVFTLLGAAVRLYGRDALPYWWDELLAVWIAGSDIHTLFATLSAPAAPASDFTPPVFYLLLHAWQGMWGLSEAYARVLTVLCSVLTIPAIHLLGKRLWGVGAGLGASVFLSLSMTAVSFSQQARCYSLLALLAVLFLLAAESLYKQASKRSMAFFLICGTLFLYTHFVATWLYAGLGATYFLTSVKKTAYRKLASSVCAVSTWSWRVGIVLAGFLLAAVCPLFSTHEVAQDNMQALLWFGTGLLALVALSGPVSSEDESRSGAADVKFLAVYCLPGLLFSPWLLQTRIWEVIAGKGAYNPEAYGLAALQSTVDFFAGLELSYAPYLLLVGLLALFVRRPRSALVMCGWVVFATGLAMLVKNKNMNLVRYLFFTQAGYPLLMAVGCFEILDGARVVVLWAAGLAVRGRAAFTSSASGLAAPRFRYCPTAFLLPLVILALFGFVGLARISFPTQAQPSEDYFNVAAFIKENDISCVHFENQNMLRAIAWYLHRSGLDTQCGRGCRKAFLFNVYPDGRPWSEGSSYVKWVKDNSRLEAVFPGFEIHVGNFPFAEKAAREGDGLGWTVNGMSLATEMVEGRSVALAGGQLHPTVKKQAGRCEYEFVMPEGAVGRLSLSITGQAVGPRSWVNAKASLGEGMPPAEAVIRGSDILKADMEMKHGTGDAQFPKLVQVASGTKVKVEVQLFDDGSGAIYSSNAGLAEVAVTFE